MWLCANFKGQIQAGAVPENIRLKLGAALLRDLSVTWVMEAFNAMIQVLVTL